ncbi:MAG: RHS repeat-associated core domain-containing protein, partial [Chloroflexi bacterium]|nr:RHS repeat-associated core domain-containing protein [Chloroflexota bacterium]
ERKVDSFAESFQSQNGDWVYSPYQTVPYLDNGQYTVKSTGTDTGWWANFYRSAYSIVSGNEVKVEFKVDGADSGAHFAIENESGGVYRRWAINAWSGKIYVQYNEGSGWVYPQDLIDPIKLNTWYVVVLRADDANGFRIEVRERDNPSVVGTYTHAMQTGLSWRFHHWMYRNTAYIASYVERKLNPESVVYVGNLYEKNVTTGEVTKYYYAEGRRIAMRKGSTLNYLLADHLGSTVSVLDANGSNPPRNSIYYSFGGSRLSPSSPATDKLYTGQQSDATGLHYYGARWYDGTVARFVSPDTIVAHPRNPQSLNRYSYAYNNPIRYADPTGHVVPIDDRFEDTEIELPEWLEPVAGVGCFFLGCNVDTKRHVITGPSKEESAEMMVASLAGPVGNVEMAGARIAKPFLERAAKALKLNPETIGTLVGEAAYKLARKVNYRAIYFAANPALKDFKNRVFVHHAIPLDVLQRYPGLFTAEELSDPGNLRGLIREGDRTLHLSDIQKRWFNFFKMNAKATREQIEQEAKAIDNQYELLNRPTQRFLSTED